MSTLTALRNLGTASITIRTLLGEEVPGGIHPKITK